MLWGAGGHGEGGWSHAGPLRLPPRQRTQQGSLLLALFTLQRFIAYEPLRTVQTLSFTLAERRVFAQGTYVIAVQANGSRYLNLNLDLE